MNRRIYALLLPTLMLAATSAYASDGVLEINQACALGSGCFTGDTSGFPVSISNPGSYVLTSDLEVSDPNTVVISVSANPITIDLNGFEIRGITTCDGSPSSKDFSCSDTGTGIAINAGLWTVTVRNGYITGMGDRGVVAGSGSIVEGVHFLQNGGLAADLGGAVIVRGNTFRNNGATMKGKDMVAGVFAGLSSQIVGNTFQTLGGSGISASAGRAADNSLQNIEGDAVIFGGGVVSSNSILGATGFGLRAGATTAYTDNALIGNVGGTVTGGIEIGSNLCGFNTTCP